MVGDREALIIIVENGGKHPSGSTATTIPYTPREKGGGALHSIEDRVYKVTKSKAVIMLYRNGDRAMAMVREFKERAEELSHSLLAKEAVKYAEELCA